MDQGAREDSPVPSTAHRASLVQSVKGLRNASGLSAVPTPPTIRRTTLPDARRRASRRLAPAAPLESFEDLISLPQLIALKEVFDAHSEPFFTPDEFAEALLPILPFAASKTELRAWFHRIDLKGHGTLTWDDFSGHLIHRSHHKVVQEDSRFEFQRQEGPRQGVDVNHRDMITCMLVHPQTAKVYTFGRDGIAKQWHPQTLEHESVLHNAGAWITGATFLRQASKLLISSVDRQLNLFDTGTGNLIRTYAGRKHVSDKRESQLRKHLYDTKKFGVKVAFQKRPLTTVESGVTEQQFAERVADDMAGQGKLPFEVQLTPLKDLTTTPMSLCCLEGEREQCCLGLNDGILQIYPMEPGKSGKCEATCRFQLHTSTVSKLHYSRYLNGIISSSWDYSLKIFNPDKMQESQHFGGEHGHQKAVFSFDWSEELQVLASCGSERRVYIWNPFLSKPVFKLDGHQQPLVGVHLNGQHGQILTLSQDKCLKVWDVRTFRCIQTVWDTVNYHPENTVSSLYFDAERTRIITGTTYPTAWPLSRVSPNFPPTYVGHNHPVLQALLIPKMRHITSTDRSQVVSWDLDTGKKMYHFRPAKQMQQSQQRAGEVVTRVTPDKRALRLITGTDRGAVVIWNLQNCQVSAIGETGQGGECTALAHFSRKDNWFIMLGVGHKLFIFDDADDVHQLRISGEYDTGEVTKGEGPLAPAIISLALCNPSLLALGLDDGRCILFNPDIGRRCGVLGVRLPGCGVESLHPLGSHHLLAAQSDGLIVLWSVSQRKIVSQLQGMMGTEGTLTAMVFGGPGDAYLVVGDSQGCIHVWRHAHRVASNTESDFGTEATTMLLCDDKVDAPPSVDMRDFVHVVTFQAHSEPVTSVIITGKCLGRCCQAEGNAQCTAQSGIVTGGFDCQVKLFNLCGEQIGAFGWHGDVTWNLHALPKELPAPIPPTRVVGTSPTADASQILHASHEEPGSPASIAAPEAIEHLPEPPKERTCIGTPHRPKRRRRRDHECSLPRFPILKPHVGSFLVSHICISGTIALTAVCILTENAGIPSAGTTFLTEVGPPSTPVPLLRLGEVVTAEERALTARAAAESIQQRMAERLRRAGVPETARETSVEAKGVEVMRQLKRQRRHAADDRASWGIRLADALKSCTRSVTNVPPPKLTKPLAAPSGWRATKCTLCEQERSHQKKTMQSMPRSAVPSAMFAAFLGRGEDTISLGTSADT